MAGPAVTVSVLGNVKDLQDKLGDATRSTSKFADDSETHAGRVGRAFAGAGKAVAAGLAVGGAAAVAFGVKAVMLASDVNESLSKVNTVFGKSAGEIDKWSKSTASSIGISRGAALDAVGSFGNMFDQLGIGEKESAKMSTGMVNLAADFASFHNADISEVIAAQTSAFRGEYDSLQRFLPLINAASVEQKALEMKMGKTAITAAIGTEEWKKQKAALKAARDGITDQDKALAVHALMVAGAGEATGDFARTSDGLANRMRILKARAEDFAAGVGTALLPVVLKAFDVFEKMGGFLQTILAPVFSEIKGGVMAFAAAWKAADGDVTSSGFPGFMEKLANFIKLTVIPAFETVIGWVQNLVGVFKSGEGETGNSLNKMGEAWKALVGIIRPAMDAIIAAVKWGVSVVKKVWSVFGDDIVAFARESWNNLMETFRGVFNAIKGIFEVFAGIFTGDWSRVWEGLKAIADGIWDALVGVIRNVFTNIIPTLISGAAHVIGAAVGAAFNGIKAIFAGIINWIIDRWNDLDFTVPKVSALGVTFGGFTIGMPDVDHIKLAKGGIVDRPTLAMIGEAGPEAVIPLGRGGAATGGGPITIQLVVDRRVLAQVSAESLRDLQRRSGNLGIQAV